MKIDGSLTLNGTLERAWQVMLDPGSLSRCIPGCEQLEVVGDHKYRATLKVGVAAVKGTYEAMVELTDIEKPRHYKLVVEGSGGPGFVKSSVSIDLEDRGPRTEVVYSVDAQVGGIVAAVGQRMLSGVAKLLFNEFFKGVNRELESAPPA